MNDLLRGAYDLHIHTSPDVTPRKCDDIELAQRLTAAGMGGCVIKCHYFDTAARALLLRKQFPHLNIVGGLVLNRTFGGINPQVVERMGRMGGKMLWFPTLDALEYQKFHHRDKPGSDLSDFLPVFDDKGRLLPTVYDVLDIAAQYDMVVGTGHIGPLEGLAVVKEAIRRGVRRVVLTHADSPADQYTIAQQREAVHMGAMVEHSYFSTFYKRTPIEAIAEQIRAVGCDRVFLSTDFGQTTSLYSDEGMIEYAELLMAQGFSYDELKQMMCHNPKQLISWEKQTELL